VAFLAAGVASIGRLKTFVLGNVFWGDTIIGGTRVSKIARVSSGTVVPSAMSRWMMESAKVVSDELEEFQNRWNQKLTT